MGKGYGQTKQRCDSCWKYKPATIYYRRAKGVSGANKNKAKWRYLCHECWELAEKGKL